MMHKSRFMFVAHVSQVLQNILEAESEFSRELQSLLGTYLRSLHPTDRCSTPPIPQYLEMYNAQVSVQA